MGIRGSTEGVIAATALDALKCNFQGRFLFKTNEDINRAKKMGIKNLDKKYEINEIVKGDSLFCATGITRSEVLNGITINKNEFISETLITHKNSNFKEIVKSVNSINE